MVQVNFRLVSDEYIKLKHDAHQHDMTISDYLRWLIKKERECDARPL